MLVFLAGCVSLPVEGTPSEDPFHDTSPTITSIVWECDVDNAVWSFDAETAGWTGGGTVWLTRDLSSEESHPIRSTGANADGSADALSLTLNIVADWRDAASGSATQWHCDDEEELNFLLEVSEPDGSDRADCRVWGFDTNIWEESSADNCAFILEPEDTGAKQ